MKMLRLSPYYAPERISSTHLTDDLEAAYAEAGFFTEIYVPTPTRGITKEEWETYRKIKYEEKYGGSLHVHRFSMFRERRNPIGRAIRYVLVNFIQYYKGIHAKDVTLITGGSTPPTQGLLCSLVAKKLSKKYKRPVPFIFNLQDMFPESLVSTRLAKKDSILYKIGEKISAYTYRNATEIMVISHNIKNALIRKGVPAEKITVIYNWVDTESINPINNEDNPLFSELALDHNKFYVTYAGNMGNTQDLDILIDCAIALKEQKDIELIVFGDGSEKSKFEKKIIENALTNIRLFPLQPIERTSQVYSLGNASFVTCRKGVGAGAFPSKAVTIMATGTPILASFDLDSDLCKIIKENKVGLCVDAEDANGLVDAILTLYNNKDLQSEYGKNARALACNQFSKQTGTKAKVALFKKYE